MSLFWKAYMLFFIVVFPMIMYYPMMDFESADQNLTGPYRAVFYLLLALLLWIALTIWYYKRNVRTIFNYRDQAQRLMETGELIEAEIIAKTHVRRTKDAEVVDLQVKLTNFSETPVEVTIGEITEPDGREPYGKGDRILLRVDPGLGEPYILPDWVEFHLDKRVLNSQYLALAAIIAFFAAYLVFSYAVQSDGYGWRFLTFFHPLLVIPFSAFIYSALILGVKRLFWPGVTASEDARFLLYGKKAQATMLSVSQTGTYINEQPEVKFVLSYTDDTGRDHKATFRLIVSLLEMHTLSQKQREILYLPDNPLKVKFV